MSVFLLSEMNDLVLYESGPFLGLAFLLWRTILTFHIGYLSVTALETREYAPAPSIQLRISFRC